LRRWFPFHPLAAFDTIAGQQVSDQCRLFVNRWHYRCRWTILDSLHSADLAGRSWLRHYETSSINIFRLAAYGCPDSLAGQEFGTLLVQPGQTLRFCISLATHPDVLPQLIQRLLTARIQHADILFHPAKVTQESFGQCSISGPPPAGLTRALVREDSDPHVVSIRHNRRRVRVILVYGATRTSSSQPVGSSDVSFRTMIPIVQLRAVLPTHPCGV
jgi:hypothetical protein